MLLGAKQKRGRISHAMVASEIPQSLVLQKDVNF
jgi:hypothetical protein